MMLDPVVEKEIDDVVLIKKKVSPDSSSPCAISYIDNYLGFNIFDAFKTKEDLNE